MNGIKLKISWTEIVNYDDAKRLLWASALFQLFFLWRRPSIITRILRSSVSPQTCIIIEQMERKKSRAACKCPREIINRWLSIYGPFPINILIKKKISTSTHWKRNIVTPRPSKSVADLFNFLKKKKKKASTRKWKAYCEDVFGGDSEPLGRVQELHGR